MTLSVAHEPTLEDIEQGVRLARENGIGRWSASAAARLSTQESDCCAGAGLGPVMEYLEVVGNGRVLEGHPRRLSLSRLPPVPGQK